MAALPTCPVMATIGTESMWASAIGVTRLVAPGPEVAMHTPTFPVAIGIAFGRVAGTLLVTHQDVPDLLGIEERVVRGKDRPSWNPEYDVCPYALERPDERLRSGQLICSVVVRHLGSPCPDEIPPIDFFPWGASVVDVTPAHRRSPRQQKTPAADADEGACR